MRRHQDVRGELYPFIPAHKVLLSFKHVLYTTWGLLCHLPFLFKMHHTFPCVQFYSILKHHVQRKIILTILCNNNVIAFYWHPDYVHHSLQDSENIYGELFQLVSQDLATLFKKTYQLQKVSTEVTVTSLSKTLGAIWNSMYLHVACFLVTYAAHSRHLFLFISLLITPVKWPRI